MGVRVGVENFFLDKSIGIDKTNTLQLTFLSSMIIVGATGLGGLWPLEWAWQTFFSIGIGISIEQYIAVKICILASKL